MVPILIGISLFALGMAIEGFHMLNFGIGDGKESKTFLLCLALSMLVSAVGGARMAGNNLPFGGVVLFLFTFIFPLLYLLIFKNVIFPRIDERILMVWTLVFIYAAIAENVLSGIGAAAALIGTIVATILVFNLKMPRPVKMMLYAWYMLMLAVLGIMQLDHESALAVGQNLHMIIAGHMADNAVFDVIIKICLLTGGVFILPFYLVFMLLIGATHNGALDMFLKGIGSFYIIICVMQLSRLIPIPAKHQSMQGRIEEWKSDVRMMADKFSDRQTSPKIMLAIGAAVIFLLTLNSYFKVLSLSGLVTIALVATSYLGEKNLNDRYARY